MTPKAYVSHAVLGRTRIQIPDRKRDTHYFESLRAKILSFPGVESVRANPLTGSVLISHRGESAAILETAAAHGLYVMAGTMEDLLELEQGGLPGSGLNSLNSHKLAFGVLMSLAAVQVVRGEWLGPASTLLSEAFKLVPRLIANAESAPDDGGLTPPSATHERS